MNAIRSYCRNIGTRAECSPAIGGVVILVVMAFLIYHYRHVVEVALICTALAVLSALAIYTAAAITVAHRRHVRAQANQAAAAPAVPAAQPAPAPQPTPAEAIDLTDQLPPWDKEFADLHSVTGVNADGTIS